MPDSPSFVFVTCQVGAEEALKRETARQWPSLRFAYSRPGFLTFKIAAGKRLPDDFDLKLVFARAAGFCLGKAQGETTDERADSAWQLVGNRPVGAVHVWPRDHFTPGFRDYEPGPTPETIEIGKIIRERASGRPQMDHKSALAADVVVIGDDEWWVGYHHVHSITSRWPGGFCDAELPPNAVSRAWLKMHEAVQWSGFCLKPGERCVELGSAPGGASQYLLSLGLDVVGVDPAKMAPAVLGDAHFRHIQKRAREVPRNEFLDTEWLTSDVNLPPNYTLDAVKAIVSHPGVRLKGLLLTLKLVEWRLADEIPKFVERIGSWGFRNVRARQLHHNRQEVCVAASGFSLSGGLRRSGESSGGARRKSARKGARTRKKRNALPG